MSTGLGWGSLSESKDNSNRVPECRILNDTEPTTKSKSTPAKMTSMEYQSFMQQMQCSTISTKINDQEFSDVTFLIGEQQTEFYLNRIFLAMISPVFKAMLYGQMKEAQPESEVVIEDMATETFDCIVKFAYCADPKITSKNVLSVVAACDKYQITQLQDFCIAFFQSDLATENFCCYFHDAVNLFLTEHKTMKTLEDYFELHYWKCLDSDNFAAFWQQIIQLNMAEFIPKCEEFINYNVREVMEAILKSDNFQMMSLKALRLFLAQSIECKEEMIWEYVAKWAEYQARTKIRCLEECQDSKSDDPDDDNSVTKISLLQSVKDLIRFGLMAGEYFTRNVVPMNVLSDKEVISVFAYFQVPKRGCGSFQIETRHIQRVSLSYRLHDSTGELKHETCTNTYEALHEESFRKGFGVRNGFIEASFGNTSSIDRIDIAAVYSLKMIWGGCTKFWGKEYLNGAKIKDSAGQTVHILSNIEDEKVTTICFDTVRTDAIRIERDDEEYLGISLLRIYGRSDVEEDSENEEELKENSHSNNRTYFTGKGTAMIRSPWSQSEDNQESEEGKDSEEVDID